MKRPRAAREPFVALLISGELTVHAPAPPAGAYAMLCGLDGDDPEIGLEPADLPPKARITCDACRGIWDVARTVRKKDFAR